MKMTAIRQPFIIAAVMLALAMMLHFGSANAAAQCVMCRASIGTNSSFIRNFNIGVGVLLVPPVSIFCTIFILAWRNRKS